jgi:hypothetical protein
MRNSLGYEPDLAFPRTFNEKLAWRILHDRNPLFPITIDKVAAREWIANRGGKGLLVPLYGVWDRVEDIIWAQLPKAFALKASHGWNMNLLIEDKAKIDRAAALATAAEWLTYCHYKHTGEWGYRDIPHRILAEELLREETGEGPTELKFHVFDGRARVLRVHNDRYGDHRVTFFDDRMQRVPVSQGPPEPQCWTLPDNVGDLFRLAGRLGAGFDYVRVDLYYVRGTIKFSELTQYESSACRPFVPVAYDRQLGDMWPQRCPVRSRLL